MKLFACMCNQPLRLQAALAPVRAALVAAPPVNRWGFGYIQGGDVLLVRTPKASAVPVDLAHPLDEIRTDCVIAQAVRDAPNSAPPTGTDNTPPFRFRRWLFAQSNVAIDAQLEGLAPRLLEHVPEYLRRNIKGRTRAELTFHLFLAMLHDEGNIDDPNLSTDATRRALALTLRMVQTEVQKVAPSDQLVPLGNVALSNGRSMVVARHGDGEPLRFRRLWLTNDRNEPERGPDAFRGVVLVSSGESGDGFEDVPANHAVLVSRDLKVTLTELAV